jgi:diguanylate cyclase (GGDEF)-like protein
MAATLALILVWRVPTSSRHMVTSLHVLMAIMVANISVQVVHGVHYQLMCVLPFYLIWIGLLPTLVVALGAVLVTSITVALAGDNPLIPENVMLAVATCMVVHFAKVQVRRQLQLASSDVLTGALNRRYLLTQLSSMRADFVRTKRISSLVLIDIDGLKSINDSFGHSAGDAVLTSFARITKERVRGSDLLFRVGGDEFALILSDAKSHAALSVSNDLRQLVKEQIADGTPDFSLSFGVCCVEDSASANDWLERADEALYEAKAHGGDTARLAA